MAFGIAAGHLSNLRDYNHAEQKYNDTKPIRGRADDTRPLGKRSAQHMRIEKHHNEHGQYYAAVLFSTECVRYYENGKIQVQHNGWASQSTTAFIRAVSPFEAFLSNNRLWVSGEMLDSGRDSLWFDKVEAAGGGYRWQCTNPRRYFIDRYNKETTKRIRSNPVIKHTQRYLKTMRAMGAYENLKSNWGWRDDTTNALFELIQQRDKDPNDESLLPVLAELGDAMRDVVPWGYVYSEAVRCGWVTHDELYIKTEIDRSKAAITRGVYIA